MGRLLIWISGASSEILKDFPGDRAKYVGIGAAILITSSIAVVSMSFALVTALKAPLWAAIPLALAWGLAILSLDRWLVVSLQRQAHWWGYLTLVLPRVLLGVLFGLIISTPFVLQIFNPEIQREISTIQTQRENQHAAQQASDPLTKKIQKEQATVNALQATISEGGGLPANPYQQPEVKSLETQLSQAEAQAKSDLAAYNCQLYGGPGCPAKGPGPVATADKNAYDSELNQETMINGEITAAVNQIGQRDKAQSGTDLQNAKAKLPEAQSLLKADLSEQAQLDNTFTVNNNSNAGLLLRLQALDEATSQDTALSGARTLLWLFFTVIECLPIGVKVLLLLGPENAYEKAVALDERTRLVAAREEALQRQAARIQAADAAREEENRKLNERETRMSKVVEAAIDAEQDVAMESIQAWKDRQLRDIRRGGHTYAPAGEQPSANGGEPTLDDFRTFVSPPGPEPDLGPYPGHEGARAWVGQDPPGQPTAPNGWPGE